MLQDSSKVACGFYTSNGSILGSVCKDPFSWEIITTNFFTSISELH